MLRRHVAAHPGDHIDPAIFDRIEALSPMRIDAYTRERFAVVLNAVLQAGLDAIDAGQAASEFTYRGATVALTKR